MSLADTARRMVGRFKGTGVVTLTRTTNAAAEAETPWIPGAATEVVYTLDAVVHGVTAQYVDGETVVASDLMVAALPYGRDEDGAIAAIVPAMSDVLTIDGAQKAIKRISQAPASGTAALFRIFVAS